MKRYLMFFAALLAALPAHNDRKSLGDCHDKLKLV